jgi:hypothetical protein
VKASFLEEPFMPSIRQKFKLAVASAVVGLAGLTAAGHSAAASVNVLVPGNWSGIGTIGTVGTLRGALWAPGVLASQGSIVDGAFLPTGTVWNQGTWWWDEDPSVNRAPVPTIIQLTSAFALDRFVIQADDNDVYQIDYWNGVSWVGAYTAPAVFTFGMETRDSGLLAPVTTDRLRITASGGDGYYSFSEIQAFTTTVVPVPGALALFATGVGVFGVAMRRRRSQQ